MPSQFLLQIYHGMRTIPLGLSSVLTLMMTCSTSFGQVPQLVNFQASINDVGGLSAETTITFQIYDAPTAGNAQRIEER